MYKYARSSPFALPYMLLSLSSEDTCNLHTSKEEVAANIASEQMLCTGVHVSVTSVTPSLQP